MNASPKASQLSPPPELRSIRDFIRWGATRFGAAELYFGHGTDSALDEAAWLVSHALHLRPDFPRDYLDARLTAEEEASICALFSRRIAERIPTAYLIGEAWFAGLRFSVNQNVLIPRSPIAECIEQGFEPWAARESVTRILDLCTGSGCIGIACAYAFPDAEVDLADISSLALEVAQKNIREHGVESRVRALESDLFAAAEGPYDIIVSNPPYVSGEEMQTLPAEFRHEPKLGLEAADLGLEIALKILREAPDYLRPDGILIVEVGNSKQALIERLPDCPFVWLEFQRGGDGVFLLTGDQVHRLGL